MLYTILCIICTIKNAQIMQYILLYFLHCNVFALHCADALISKDCCEEQFVNILFPWIDSQRFGLKSQRFHKSSKNAPYFKTEEVFLLKDFFLKKAVPYQSRWIFGNAVNGLWPPLVSDLNIAEFVIILLSSVQI